MSEDKMEFLTSEEVADLLKVSVSSIYRLIGEGKLPAIRIGSKGSTVRILKKDLDPFMEPCFTPKEVADILRVSISAVYRWIDNGTLPAIKFGGENYTRRISKKAFSSFIESHKVNIAQKSK